MKKEKREIEISISRWIARFFFFFRGDLIDSLHVFAIFDDVNRKTSLPSSEMIPSQHSTTMHWFAMVGEDETSVDLLDLGRIHLDFLFGFFCLFVA
jgi:hypothetical protein